MAQFRWQHALFLGLVTYAASVTTPVFNTFVPDFLQAGHPLWENQNQMTQGITGLALAPSLAFFIMTWDNLINLFVHPWAGARSDQTRHRWGRRKPWILLGAPIAAAGFLLIPFAGSLWTIVVAILIANFGRALFVPALVAWLGDLYPPEQRSRANAIFSLIAGIAAAIVLVGSGLLIDRVGPAAPFVVTAIFMLILAGLGIRFIREPAQPSVAAAPTVSMRETMSAILRRQNRTWIIVLFVLFLNSVGTNVVETGNSSFAVFELGMTLGQASIVKVAAVVSFLLFALPSALIAARIGRRAAVNVGILMVALVYLGSYLFVTTPMAFAVALFLGGIAGALVLVNILPLVFDVGDERYIGTFTGLASIPLQLASVVGPTLAGLIVEAAGSQRILFLVAAVSAGCALLLLQRVSVESLQPAGSAIIGDAESSLETQ